jgi:hypothetical protein
MFWCKRHAAQAERRNEFESIVDVKVQEPALEETRVEIVRGCRGDGIATDGK